MRIVVHIRPGARQQKVERMDDGQYRVWVKSKPEKGKANAELLTVLANYFAVPTSATRIVIGKTAREKLVEIVGTHG